MESQRVGHDLAHTHRGESADRRKTCPKMDIKEILCPGSQVIKRCSMKEEKGGINSVKQPTGPQSGPLRVTLRREKGKTSTLC